PVHDVGTLPYGNAANTDYRFSLAIYHNNIGLALGRLKRFDEAFPAFEAGLAIRLKLVETAPKQNLFLEVLRTSYAFRGSLRVRAGQPAEAAADLRKALELLAKLPRLQPQIQFDRAQALANLAGLAADAKSGGTKEEANAFADQSVAALADIV